MTLRQHPRLSSPTPNHDWRSWGSDLVKQMHSFLLARQEGPREVQGYLRTQGGRVQAVAEVGAGTYTIKRSDEIVDVNFAGAVTLTLPAEPIRGARYIVEDSSGAAAANNITVNPPAGINLNGGTGGLVLATNYGKLTFRYNGTQYVGN